MQTVLGAFKKPVLPAPTKSWHVPVGNGDFLCCECSIPDAFTKIVVLVHGLGGSHASNYMIRMSRKLYDKKIMAVRVNLRGCGTGVALSSLPYHGGRSDDILAVLKALKAQYPTKDIDLVGFSLGANIVLKLAGELSSGVSTYIRSIIAVCPPLDLAHTVARMQQKKYGIYHSYFLKKVCQQAKPWVKTKINSIYDFDDKITARLWGFSGAEDYYKQSSSIHYLSSIQCPCRLLFAQDDPFISTEIIKAASGMPVEVFTTKYGGHMGFLGKTTPEHNFQWLDQQLLEWLD